jgi:hypothetical protein
MQWLRRNETEGNLRFHFVDSTSMGAEIAKEEIAAGMKTRIDFFFHGRSDAAYDVASSLIECGHRVMARPVEKIGRSRSSGGGYCVEC